MHLLFLLYLGLFSDAFKNCSMVILSERFGMIPDPVSEPEVKILVMIYNSKLFLHLMI